MEYFVGAIATLATVFLMNRLIGKSMATQKLKRPMFSQTRLFEMTADMIPIEDLLPSFSKRPDTQTSRHFDQNSTRILFMDGMVWFIKNNALYNVESEDGQFEEESAKKVDTMGMDKVQLDKTIFIVEKLTEGIKNDSGNSGK
jgi:hypothetical protein